MGVLEKPDSDSESSIELEAEEEDDVRQEGNKRCMRLTDRSKEALRTQASTSTADHFTIEYNILLSSSYQVPVLYFIIRDASGNALMDLDQVHAILVPESFRTQVTDIGIIGGISYTVVQH